MEGNICTSMSSDAVTVKEEVLWEQVVDSHGVSEAAALAGLYTDHEVKEELVIGPEVLQPPDAVFTAYQTCANSERFCGCHRDQTYAKTESPKAEVLVKEEVVECLRGEAAREASAVREQPADFVGPLEARRGTRPVPNSDHVGNQIHTKADIDTEKETFVCDICEQRFALKAWLLEHVTIHVHRSAEREEIERSVADNDSRGVSEAAALAGLYTDHEVKEELVIGPEVLQPPDAVFTADQTCASSERSRSCPGDHTYAKTESPKAEVLVKEEVVECLRGEAAREASAVREQPADFVGPLERSDSLEARRGTRPVPNSAHVGNQIHTKTDRDSEAETFVYDIHVLRFALKARLMEHVTIHVHRSAERGGSERGVADNGPGRLVNKEGQANTNKFKTSLQTDKRKWERKVMRNSDDRPFKCSQCSFTSSFKKSLTVHLRTHTGEKPFKCNHCISAFTQKGNLQAHLRTHTGEKPFQCNLCSSMFTSKSSLRLHLRTHNGEKPFKCNHCSSAFTRRAYLQAHLKTHTGEKPFQCNLCSSMFTSKSSLRVHLRTHTGEKPFKCNHCKSAFTQRGNLQAHLRTHTSEKPFKCNHCSSMFANKSYLRVHLITHTGEKPFKCNHCNSAFTWRGHLLNHLRTHTGEKPFQCNLCSSMFTSKSSLRYHLRTHTGEKPFQCNVCSSMFTSKSHLQVHLRTHTGEKPFKCNHCSSMFANKSYLRVHLRTHTGEKPFKCNHCSSAFTRRHNLRAHLRTHTGEKPF